MPDRCDDTIITLTTVQDLANIVAKAVEYEGTWPVLGGVKGCDVSITELIRLAEEIRGTYPTVVTTLGVIFAVSGHVHYIMVRRRRPKRPYPS